MTDEIGFLSMSKKLPVVGVARRALQARARPFNLINGTHKGLSDEE